jgi:transcriptional regulator with XRE-family HTH domain
MNIHFKNVIIEKLKEKEISRKDLAEKIGISKSYLDHLLSSKSKKRLNEDIESEICKVLKIEIEYKTKEEAMVNE